MKSFFTIALCFILLKGFSQTNELVMEERSSDWIKVTANVRSVTKPKTTTVKKKTNPKKTMPKQNAQQEFEKTNNEVNRFKKSKNK